MSHLAIIIPQREHWNAKRPYFMLLLAISSFRYVTDKRQVIPTTKTVHQKNKSDQFNKNCSILTGSIDGCIAKSLLEWTGCRNYDSCLFSLRFGSSSSWRWRRWWRRRPHHPSFIQDYRSSYHLIVQINVEVLFVPWKPCAITMETIH